MPPILKLASHQRIGDGFSLFLKEKQRGQVAVTTKTNCHTLDNGVQRHAVNGGALLL
jgi:hypothetical protein